MMPIIKKWLYSDKDIFLREIVANGVDAITKFKKLVDMGEAKTEENEEYRIDVRTDEAAKTLTIEDNGIGMSEEEVEKYITQIAFSGAEDFLQKYEKASGDGIIGHFGLGFYSAYMVANDVEIFTKGIKEGEKDENGKEKQADKPINNTHPLYLKDPKECTDEEYKAFYRDTFSDYDEPLFWIHLNMEYPFRLKGILYFPKVKQQVQLEKGQVKLYCNQVFIADNIKEVIPEFLMLLNGVIDCPDIPLNVSRSFLQNDRQVQKIAKHITKKVADKLTALFKDDRERYENCWKDISTFIKFGCIKDEEFYDKVKDIVIFKNLEGKYLPVSDFFGEEISDEDAKNGKQPKAVYYVSDEAQQAQYIRLFKDAGLDALVCDTYIDPHFISFIEYKNPRRCRFVRIDADVDAALKSEEEVKQEDYKDLVETVKKHLVNKDIAVKADKLKNVAVPAVINVEEFMRRMSEMNKFYGMTDEDVMKNATLVLNVANETVAKLLSLPEDKQEFAINQIYYLAMLSYKKLSPDELADFMKRSEELLADYVK